jgi:hypothetical protein
MAYTNIDDPSAYFQVATYTGNGSTQSITNDGNSDMQPDWVWIKSRSNASWHSLQDSSRGATKTLFTNTTNAEITYTDAQTSFDSDGFSLGADTSGGSVNVSSRTYVAWNWKANGGTTTSKSSTTIDTNVTTPCVQQVNTDAGFSIITYTASSSYAGTETHLEHGLGVGPKVLFVKRRDTAANWAVYHAENGASPNAGYGYLVLNSDVATATSSTYWLNTPAESNATLLAFGNNTSVGADGGEYVCYAFAEKQGYSKFGKYVGNGSTNGPFVYTGFKPALIITKNADGTDSWNLLDNKRSPYNVANKYLQADNANAEGTYTFYDILSNGFKIRNTGNANISGNTITYMAFAENPFVTSTGIPTTAR